MDARSTSLTTRTLRFRDHRRTWLVVRKNILYEGGEKMTKYKIDEKKVHVTWDGSDEGSDFIEFFTGTRPKKGVR